MRVAIPQLILRLALLGILTVIILSLGLLGDFVLLPAVVLSLELVRKPVALPASAISIRGTVS